jgi:cytochrome c2
MVLMRWFKPIAVVAGFAATLFSATVVADTGDTILEAHCVECHELKGSGPVSLAELWAQKGPNFSYAGNKYKQGWLEQWLVAPTRIRPAGMFYGNHIKPGPEQDEVDEASLIKHMALEKDDAKAVAAALMRRKAKSELITPGAYKPGTISLRMGELTFDKFRGCLACHQIEPGYGGISGPEVYTVAKRLQKDYIISFIQDPQAWSPLTFMPKRPLKDKDLQKLVYFFNALSEEDFK